VFANDLNPASFQYLNENLTLNKVRRAPPQYIAHPTRL
jgi:tRNA G37 N-methylase Trm5